MFGIDWGDSQTLWLNLTNLFLGAVTFLAVAGVCYTLLRDVVAKRVTRDATEGSHTFFDPELGLTMADGGEPETKPKKTQQPRG